MAPRCIGYLSRQKQISHIFECIGDHLSKCRPFPFCSSQPDPLKRSGHNQHPAIQMTSQQSPFPLSLSASRIDNKRDSSSAALRLPFTDNCRELARKSPQPSRMQILLSIDTNVAVSPRCQACDRLQDLWSSYCINGYSKDQAKQPGDKRKTKE